MELEYRVTWPRRGRPPERRYKVYKTQAHAYTKVAKLIASGFERKDIEVHKRSVEVGEWRLTK